MNEKVLDQYIEQLQHSFNITIRRFISELSKESGVLTGPQYYILQFLQQNEKCTISTLADVMFVKPSATTAMIDRLYKSGLVLRNRDDKDRRVVFVQLSEKGCETLAYTQKKRKSILKKYLLQLNLTEVQSLVEINKKIAEIATPKEDQRE